MKTECLFDQVATESRTTTRALWMVVDDNEGLLNLVANLLETLGVAEVQRFHSAADALTAFTSAPDRFQFVITDLEMPGMDGFELCRRLHQVAPQLKIVLATGSRVADEQCVRRCGFCGMLAKPFPVTELWRALKAAGVLDNSKVPSNN